MASGQRPTPVGWYEPPLYGRTLSITIAFISGCLIAFLLASKVFAVKDWRLLPYTMWGEIESPTFIFVFGSTVLQFGVGTNFNEQACTAAMGLCLFAYVSSKQVFIYLFLVDRAHIVRGSKKPRLKSKLYIFNSFGMLGIYVVITIMNFVLHIAEFDKGHCVIGLQKPVIIPLIGFDALVNFQRTPANIRLRKLAKKTFIGSCCTLASSVTNLTVLMALNGEESWLCLMCCNSDILFSAIVMHWLTSNEHTASKKPAYANAYARRSQASGPTSKSATDETAVVAQPLMVATPETAKFGPSVGDTGWSADTEANSATRA
ncbi:hypothetical protein J7T55_014807 [Diaporthe amygdali]|uniref:uncharacterized protein n=1 Tax=Phomopsis amygdali TaxID=1214568 RepID=UPI0022FEA89D|nr:uncharacterized protein J7T55_014807 [Diaporthe amygdali]KAJ0110005.1 hypothetical protein J7T55_014807 [Diaporthe amygdali]